MKNIFEKLETVQFSLLSDKTSVGDWTLLQLTDPLTDHRLSLLRLKVSQSTDIMDSIIHCSGLACAVYDVEQLPGLSPPTTLPVAPHLPQL